MTNLVCRRRFGRLWVFACLVLVSLAASAEVFTGIWGQRMDPWNGVYLSSPVAVAPDQYGNLYVADMGNNRLVRFQNAASASPTTAIIGGIGSYAGQFNLPFGVTTDNNGDLLVVDTANARVQKFNRWGGWLMSFGSKGDAAHQFAFPREIAVDGANNYYVTDEYHHQVKVFDSLGNFIRAFGGYGFAPGQFRMPQGIAVDAAGRVYVADTFNLRVQVLTATGQPLTAITGLNFPRGVGLDAGGRLYVANTFSHQIIKYGAYDPVANTLSPLYAFGGPHEMAFPNAVRPAGNGVVYVSDTGNSLVLRYQDSGSAATLAATLGLPRTQPGQFSEPTGVVVGQDGRVYVADSFNNRIQVFSPHGVVLATWGRNGGAGGKTSAGSRPGQFDKPQQLATDAQGRIYVADRDNRRVQILSADGAYIDQVPRAADAAAAALTLVTGVAVDPSGRIYLVDWLKDRVVRFKADRSFDAGYQIGGLGLGDGQFFRPTQIAADRFGNVYVTDTLNGRVQKFGPEGAFLAKWGTNGGNANHFVTPFNRGVADGEFFYPQALAVVGDYVFVADTSNNRLQKFTLDGSFVGKWGSFSGVVGQFFNPLGVGIGPYGEIYVSDQVLQRVQKFSADEYNTEDWMHRPW